MLIEPYLVWALPLRFPSLSSSLGSSGLQQLRPLLTSQRLKGSMDKIRTSFCFLFYEGIEVGNQSCLDRTREKDVQNSVSMGIFKGK